MAIIRLIYSSSGDNKNGYTVKCIRNMYMNLLGLLMAKNKWYYNIFTWVHMIANWSVSTMGQVTLVTCHILERNTYVKWEDMISGLCFTFYLLSDYEQASQPIQPASWPVNINGNIYPVWLHGS